MSSTPTKQAQRLALWKVYSAAVPLGSRCRLNSLTLGDLQKLVRDLGTGSSTARWSRREVEAARNDTGARARLVGLLLPAELAMLVNCWTAEFEQADDDAWFAYLGRCARRHLMPIRDMRYRAGEANKRARRGPVEDGPINLTLARRLLTVMGYDRDVKFRKLCKRTWGAEDRQQVGLFFECGGAWGIYADGRPLGWRVCVRETPTRSTWDYRARRHYFGLCDSVIEGKWRMPCRICEHEAESLRTGGGNPRYPWVEDGTTHHSVKAFV